MFLHQMQVGRMAVFAYIVGDQASGEGLVIDPAGEVNRLVKTATDNEITVKYIVNTHGHVDHMTGNAEMKAKTGAQIVVHKDDAELVMFMPAPIFRMHGAEKSPHPDVVVNDGDEIKVGEISLLVIHTPGHTLGGMSLYTEGYVFTGDTLFVESVGSTAFPGGSWPTLRHSIMERLFTLPDDTVVLPGHNYGRMPSSTIGHEKMYNPFLK
ncbi:MAG TPA: MBL fold metallo-hydrolase [Syntrophales bacterium]|nr:MBL fold metallo-hydrolase [Syntrophales bacterium]